MLRYANAFADWMFLAMIALSRCLGMLRPFWAETYLTGKYGFGITILVWLYSLGLMVPAMTGVGKF